MLKILPAPLRGILAMIILSVTTLVFGIVIFIAALVRLIPIKSLQTKITHTLHEFPEYWTDVLKIVIVLCTKTRWHVHGLKQLKKDSRYLMIANHRSWLDILVLQRVFSRKIPGLRFFMKKELLWQLPILGYVCKLLGYPYMKRYSSKFLKKHPELKGKDLEETKKVCERFKDNPVTLINFIEGGRFTEEKHQRQKSPYKYLLKPKAGGIAFILAAMGKQLDSIIDVTIIYPDMKISFWKFLCGKISYITVYIHTIPIKQELLGDYQNDAHFRKFFQYWLNEQWAEKDKFITNKLGNYGSTLSSQATTEV